LDPGKQVWIYTPEITPRISYACAVLFDGHCRLTDSRENFASFEGPRINYSAEKTGNAFHVVPYGLLSEQSIKNQQVNCFDWLGLRVFFATDGDIPFDIFSAAFYLVSRYEEYLPYEPDRYGRFPHTAGLAYREGFLRIPLVNFWTEKLYTLLQATYPAWAPPAKKFSYLPTYDVDIAYRYLGQPVWKNVLGFFRDMVQGKLADVLERGNVYSGRAKDPFDVFAWLDTLHTTYRLEPVWFFLTLLKRGEYDKNLLADSKYLQALYKRLAGKYVTGLHPSWQSGTEETLLQAEKHALEKIIQYTVFISRQHYLRFTLPHTYRRLTDAGITDDHSMAYGSVNGFRASYALPYRWYDLEREKETGLVIHPFCFMEAASFFEQGYSAAQAREELQHFHDVVKQVGGQLVTLFHNHFLTEQPEWVQWREMYADFLAANFSQ